MKSKMERRVSASACVRKRSRSSNSHSTVARDGAGQPMGAGEQRVTMCTSSGTLGWRTSPEEDRCRVLSDVCRRGAGPRLAEKPVTRGAPRNRPGHRHCRIRVARRDAGMPAAGTGPLGGPQQPSWQPHCARDLLHRARAPGASARIREEDAEDSERGPGPGPQTHEGDRAMRKRTTKKAGIGSAFDDFLTDEGTYEATQSVAIKRVLAWQIEKAMKKQRLTKAEMARRMETSRSQLDRLLDPDSDSVTLETLTRAARAIGRQVKLELV